MYKIYYDDMYGGMNTLNNQPIDILNFFYSNKQYPIEIQSIIKNHIKENGMKPLELTVIENGKKYKHKITFDTSKIKGVPLYYMIDQRAAELAKLQQATELAKQQQATELAKQQQAAKLAKQQQATELAKQQQAAKLAKQQQATELAKQQQATELAKQQQQAAELAKQQQQAAELAKQQAYELERQQIVAELERQIMAAKLAKQQTISEVKPQLDDQNVQKVNPVELAAAEKLQVPIKSVNDIIKEKIKTLSNLIIYTVQFPTEFNMNIFPYDGNGDRNPAYNKAFYEGSTLPGSFPGKSSSSIIRIYERRFPHLKYDVDDTKSTIFLVLHTDKDEYKRLIFSKITKNTKIIIVGHCCNSNVNGNTIVSDYINNAYLDRLYLNRSDLNRKYINRDATNFSLIVPASLFTSYIKNANISKLGIIELNACNAYLHFKEPLFTSLNSDKISFFGIISNMDPITRLSSITVEDNKDVYDSMNILGDNSIITIGNKHKANFYLKTLFDTDTIYVKVPDPNEYYQTTFNSNRIVECKLKPQMSLMFNQMFNQILVENVYFYLITKCPNNNNNELFYYNNSTFIRQCLNYRIVRIKYHGVYFVSPKEYTDNTILNKIIVGTLLFEAFYDINRAEADSKLYGKPNGTFIQRFASDMTNYVLVVMQDTTKNITSNSRFTYSGANTITFVLEDSDQEMTMNLPLIGQNFTATIEAIKYTNKLIPYKI